MKPRNLKQYGTTQATQVAKNWADSWRRGDALQPGLLLHGPPGTGKSTLARCLANTCDWPLIDVNASMARRKKDIQRIRAATLTRGFSTTGRQLIFLDEMDSLSGYQTKRVTNLLKETRQPILLACNDLSEVDRRIRDECLIVEVPEPTLHQKKRLANTLDHDLTEDELRACSTFRDVLHGGRGDAFDRPDDMQERIIARLRGEDVDVRPSEWWAVPAWLADNVDPFAAARFDEFVQRYRDVGRTMTKYVDRVLDRAEAENPEFPWSVGVKASEPEEITPINTPDNDDDYGEGVMSYL